MRILTLILALAGTSASAAGDSFFSLANTDFVVLLAFLLFIGILVYFKVPALLGGMLDRRADTIQAELDEARALREEAQALLASYERKQRDVRDQAARIVEQAKREAEAAAEQARTDLGASIDRRVAAAEEQIGQAEANAVKEVRDRAVAVSIAAARQIIARQMTPEGASARIDASIDEIGAKLH